MPAFGARLYPVLWGGGQGGTATHQGELACLVCRGVNRIGSNKGTLADWTDQSSNQIAEILADWNTILQQSKLARKQPSNINEGEQTDAPQVGLKTRARMRKRA